MVEHRMELQASTEPTSEIRVAFVPDEPMLRWFGYEHLHPTLREVSKPFCDLAWHIANNLPRNPERTVALRKLLESKDCAVRAALTDPPPRPFG